MEIALIIFFGLVIIYRQSQTNKKLNKMALDFTKLTADVAAETDADVAVENLLTVLIAAIKDAGTDQAKLDALTDQMEANKTALSAATVANTPAA